MLPERPTSSVDDFLTLLENSVPQQPPPCPPWCALLDGHEYDLCNVEANAWIRFHCSDPGWSLASVTQKEIHTHEHVELRRAKVSHYLGDADLDADTAEALAAALAAATTLLRQIAGHTGSVDSDRYHV